MGRKTCSWLYFMEYKTGWKYSFSFWSAIDPVGENSAVVCWSHFYRLRKNEIVQLCVFLSDSMFSDIMLVVCNGPWWEYIQHGNGKKKPKKNPRFCFILLNFIYLFFWWACSPALGQSHSMDCLSGSKSALWEGRVWRHRLELHCSCHCAKERWAASEEVWHWQQILISVNISTWENTHSRSLCDSFYLPSSIYHWGITLCISVLDGGSIHF